MNFIFITISFFFIVNFSTAQSSDNDSLKLKWQLLKLNNGLRVLLQPDLTQKEVSVEFWIHTGAKDERPGMHGFAHFFEHATPYGLQYDSNLLKKFYALRTNSNAQTRKDYTRYFVQMKPEGLALALKYTADRLQAGDALFQDSMIEKHRTNVLNEMKRQAANPLSDPEATGVREAATFGKDHVYGHSTYGTINENDDFSTSDVKNWYAKNFFAGNMILFIVGNFDTKEIKPLVEKEFGTVTKKGTTPSKKEYLKKTSAQSHALITPTPLHHLSLTWMIPGYGSKTQPVFSLMARVIEDRLTNRQLPAIEKTGSNDLLSFYASAGCFGLYATFSDIRDSSIIENHLRSIIKEIVQEGISEEELLKAKQSMLNSIHHSLEKLGFIGSRTELLGEGLIFTNDPGYYYKMIQKVNKKNIKDIQQTTAKWLKNDGARVLSISKEKITPTDPGCDRR